MLPLSPSLAPREHCDLGGVRNFTAFPARPAGRPGRDPICSGIVRFPTSLKVQAREGFAPKRFVPLKKQTLNER